jgi:hypothetical protein
MPSWYGAQLKKAQGLHNSTHSDAQAFHQQNIQSDITMQGK